MIEFQSNSKRLTLKNKSIIENAPLQVYSLALLFAPEPSAIRNIFQAAISN